MSPPTMDRKHLAFSEITDETEDSYQVKLTSTGNDVWVSKKMILDCIPHTLIIPLWYYKKRIMSSDVKEAEGCPD